MSDSKIILVTTPNVPEKKVVRTLGLVRGNTIRVRHVGKDIMAALRNLVGGEVTEYAKLLAESREQALDRMIAEAEKLDKPRGALVVSVADGSPSEKGGIKSGDIILEFDGKIINQMKELPLIVAQTEVGKTVNVKV